jgi:hypothetical protein
MIVNFFLFLTTLIAVVYGFPVVRLSLSLSLFSPQPFTVAADTAVEYSSAFSSSSSASRERIGL